MIDKLARYLIVDAQNVTKTVYKTEEEFSMNEFYTYYSKENIIKANKIFKKNNVPGKFRKIIIKLDNIITPPVGGAKDGKEYISKSYFYIRTGKNGKEKVISGSYRPNENSIYSIYCDPQSAFSTTNKTVPYREVIKFLSEVKKADCLYNYINAVCEILNLNQRKTDSVYMEADKVLMEKLGR